MSYQVPQHIDPNKVFLINHSELEGRLDSDFYNPSYYQIFDSEKVKWVRLKTVIKNLKHPPEYKRIFATEGYQLIRSQNVRPSGINLCESPVYLADEAVQSSAIFPHVNDILIVRSGVNAGDVAVVEEEYKKVTIGADTLLLNVTQDVLPKFVQIYFMTEIGRKQLNRHITGATNKHLNSYSLKRVYFPKVNLLTQSNCVSIIESAFVENKQKEEQAKALLQSIDEYLLGELGIERPSPTRTENGRFFYTSHKEVTGKRLDPLAYSEQAKLLKQSITSGKYSCSTLKSLIIQEAAGDWGIDVIDDYDESIYSKCLVLRSTEFSLNHNIVVDNSKAKYRLISNRKLDSIDLQPNDLIIEKSGGSENQPVGRIAIITKDLYERDKLCYSNFVQKIRLDNSQVIPTYACFFLRLVHNMRLTETMQSQTNGIRNLILSEYYNQQIPIPPIEKQKEIIYHIGTLYNRAKQLQHEATTILSDAKQEIEQMILG